MQNELIWLAAGVLVLVSAPVGYVILAAIKYKELIRVAQVEKSAIKRALPRETIPDRRGMGAQSDFISQTFVPEKAHRAEQVKMVRTLIALGSDPAEAADRVGISIDLLNQKAPCD